MGCRKEKASISEETGQGLKKEMGLMNGVALIIGIIVGSGIFVSPKGVVMEVHSVGLSLLIWAACGFMAICGAMCYAELGTSIVKSGADYAYAYEAFGPLGGFLYLWDSIVIIIPTTNAIMALAFAQYVLQPLFNDCTPPDTAVRILAAVVICFLTFINCWKVKAATRVTDVFSLAKILALLLITITGAVYMGMGNVQNFENAFDDSTKDPGSIAVAIYAGIFSYAGWSYLNFVTEELKEPAKNLPRAIYISISLITVIYVMVNVAYFAIMTPKDLLASDAVAVTFGERTLGVAAFLIPLLVACSTFGSLNGIILTGSRVFFVGARDGQLPEALAMINPKLRTPIPACLFICMCSLCMLLTSDVYKLITYAAFVESAFNAVSVAGMLWLRKKRPDLPRPLKVHLFWPVTFLIICAFLIVFPLFDSPMECGMGLLITIVGVPVYWIGVVWKSKPKPFLRFVGRFTHFIQKFFYCVPDLNPEEKKQ